MRTLRIAMLLTLIAALVVIALPTTTTQAATTTKTITITEAQINGSLRVTNPVRPNVSGRSVSIGAGTATVSETVTFRNGKSHSVVTVWAPTIGANGALRFNFQSATINAAAAASSRDYNWSYVGGLLREAIRDYVRAQVGGPFMYKSISLTPGLVTITVDVYSR